MYVKTNIFFVSLLCLIVFCNGAYEVNKCCSGDKQFNKTLKCTSIQKEDGPVVLATRKSIDVVYDKFNFSSKVGMIPCGGREFIVKSTDWFQLEKNGNLLILGEDGSVEGKYSKESYCIERWNIAPGQYQDIAYLCPCIENICISKCCVEGMQIYTSVGSDKKVDRNCERYDSSGGAEEWHYDVLNGTGVTAYHEMIHRIPDCKRRLALQLEGKYSLRKDGFIESETDGIIHYKDYCGDYTLSGNGKEQVGMILACLDRDERPLGQRVFFAVLSTIGELFLLLTIILHLWLPELAGLHARCLVMHAGCLLMGLICTSVMQLTIIPPLSSACNIIGYLMQFSFLASFFWLNIMCVDMSYTFSALRPTSKGSQKQRDLRKFRWYSFYAWGCTSAFTLAAIAVDFTPGVPSTSPFKPNLGNVKCWFNSTQSLLLYFYGPMGILLLANLILFVYTTWRIVILSRGSEALHQGDSSRHGGSPTSREKRRYILYAKMFSLMGVTWLTEIISWAAGGPTYIWYFTDSINLLRAVFIFIIFCWKPRVWTGVKRKYSHIKKSLVNKLGIKINEENQVHENSEPSTDSSKTHNSGGVELKNPK